LALELLDQNVRDRAGDLNREFSTAQPFRYVVIDQFLNPDFCRQLISEFPVFEPTRALNERGEVGRKAVFVDVPNLGPSYQRFDDLIRGRELLDWIGKVTGIPNLLYDPEYVGGGTHENLHGQDLDSHVDFNYHPERNWHRRLNLIVFLNPEWHPEWGGCLELLTDPWTQEGARPVASVVPIANRAVIFETNEHSWHGFRRIDLPEDKQNLSRKSLAVYYYTEERPTEEVEASHGTIYVQRQLSEHIQPGYTLRQEDVDEIQMLLYRRDVHAKFLYERELEFSRVMTNLMNSRAFKLGQKIARPLRALRTLAGRNPDRNAAH